MSTHDDRDRLRTRVKRKLVEMAWDPITRIVGSLGIYTKIDFDEPRGRRVQEHVVDLPRLQRVHEAARIRATRTSSPAASAASAATTTPPAPSTPRTWRSASSRRRWRSGSSTSAKRPSTCSTTTSSRTTWSAWTSASRWSKETNPSVLAKAETTAAPHATIHGYRTIADIMRSFNPFTGEFYREALQMSRLTREMFCLMEGRHVHPSTLYPGGVGTVARRSCSPTTCRG